jgi:hypothetical protein
MVQLGLQTLGEDFRDTLFRDIWDKPLCDIFTPKDDAEFAGSCDADVIGDNAKCTTSAFCDGLDHAQRAGTETIIATQFARSVFAFIEGPAGVIQQRSATTKVCTNPCCYGTSFLSEGDLPSLNITRQGRCSVWRTSVA